ncbi:MAG: histidine--tRNA ligase, partial [Patescibacteria group bacterium]|nr:histidine--tRNA ligase [Patescibacteria group bacterium]
KGFRDFLPNEARKRAYAINVIKQVFENHGFEPIETPALEYQELLLGKYGSEADKLIYKFKDNGGRDIALRYDQTVPTARVLAMYNQNLPMPFRRYQIQTVWRAENTQKGRYREFLQCDADIFGSHDPLADAECIFLAYAIYKKLGFNELTIYLNDRNILFDILEKVGISKNLQLSVIQSIDKLDKKQEEEVASELSQKGLSAKIINNLFKLLKYQVASDYLEKVIKNSKSLGVPESSIAFLPALARGLDYYTSTIFEIKAKGYESGSLLGGGRYDKLIANLCGIDIPAVGFAIGFDRTIDAMTQLNLFNQSAGNLGTLVAVFSESLLEKSIEIVNLLRNQEISAEIYPDASTKLDKQLKYADKKGLTWFIVVGPSEAEKDTAIIKNLKTGHQEEVKAKEICKKINQFS